GEVLEVKGKTLRDQLGERLIEDAGANFEAPVVNQFPNRPVRAGREDEEVSTPRKAKSEWVSARGKREIKRSDALDRLDTKPKRRSDGSRASNVWMAPGARPESGKPKRKPNPNPKPKR
ncbi:MAG: pseudouridylate synthase, partial [Pseudomonadota bacterium]